MDAIQTFPARTPKILNIILWIAQGILAAMFLLSGGMKLINPPHSQFPVGLAYFIGLAELLGAVGLLLPSITRIKPQLTPLAALGLAIIMILATFFHLSKGQASVIWVTLFIAALGFFVAWGRYKKAPIQPK